jgi:hypothetical protein
MNDFSHHDTKQGTEAQVGRQRPRRDRRGHRESCREGERNTNLIADSATAEKGSEGHDPGDAEQDYPEPHDISLRKDQ